MDLEKILKNIPDKKGKTGVGRKTTSYQFKKDLNDFFGEDYKDKNIVELGTHFGYSAYFLSFYFKNIFTIERWEDCANAAKENNKSRDNVHIIQGDLYDKNTWIDIIKNKIEVIFIDAGHTYDDVMRDTLEALERFKNITIIYDDYGLPGNNEVNLAVNKLIQLGKITPIKKVGYPKGSDIFGTGEILEDWEGIICKSNINTGSDFNMFNNPIVTSW